MPRSDSDSQILADARERARVVLEALERDAAELAASPGFAEGAARCEDAAEQARRLIAEIDAALSAKDTPAND